MGQDMTWPRSKEGRNEAGLRGAAAVLLLLFALTGCGRTAPAPSNATRAGAGNITEGEVVIVRAACGSCHYIPGIFDADGRVGPPLNRFGRRAFIAGMLPNSPDNLAYWLRFSQKVVPGNAMPNTELTQREARDAAAYLESLR